MHTFRTSIDDALWESIHAMLFSIAAFLSFHVFKLLGDALEKKLEADAEKRVLWSESRNTMLVLGSQQAFSKDTRKDSGSW